MGSRSDQSSDEELEDYTSTNILLGYASREPPDDPFNQLGGRPTWPDQAGPPSAAFAKCKVCNRPMTLLLQLNGDLPERFAGHERRLYIFACRSKFCKKKAGSIRAIRGTKISASASATSADKTTGNSQNIRPQAPPPMLGDSIFGTTTSPSNNANPFSSPNPFASSASAPNPFSALASKPPQPPSTIDDLPQTFAQKARIASPPPPPPPTRESNHEPWPPESDFPSPYPSYYLEADYETLDNTPSPSAASSQKYDIDEDATSSGGNSKDDTTAYESTMDSAFQKFASRLAHNPLQVLRYEFGGTPLLYSKTDTVGKLFSAPTPRIPRCESCRKERVFELQLTPHAIAELEAEEVGLEGMEWGSVAVGVCAGDCSEGKGWGWREEWVGVQWEESGGVGGGVGVKK